MPPMSICGRSESEMHPLASLSRRVFLRSNSFFRCTILEGSDDDDDDDDLDGDAVVTLTSLPLIFLAMGPSFSFSWFITATDFALDFPFADELVLMLVRLLRSSSTSMGNVDSGFKFK